jgi:antitoxin ParD1/3/4
VGEVAGLAAKPRKSVYISTMNIRLPPDQQKWLEAQVAAGLFGSVDEAVSAAVADFMAANGNDFAWARPYVDEARAAAARGEVVPLDEALDDIDSHLASLRR